MTGDHHDELPAMNLSVVAVALTPSCLVWILTVMPAWLYFSSFPFCSVRFFCFLTRHLINYTSVNCLWFLLSSVSLQSNWAWKTLKFGLWNLLRNFILNSWKRKKARVVRERVGHEQFCGWCDGELVLAELFTLYSDRTRSFNQWHRALDPNFIITWSIAHILSRLTT